MTLIVDEGIICNDHAVSSAKSDVLKSKWAEQKLLHVDVQEGMIEMSLYTKNRNTDRV